MSRLVQKLALGTAQFGDAYGVTNATGRLSDDAVHRMVQLALDRGIRTFDTAVAYGDAELRLAAALESAGLPLRVVTKISLADLEKLHPREILARSATRFEGCALDVLIHSVSDYQHPGLPSLIDALVSAKESGLIGQVGASIYDETDLVHLASAEANLDVVQLPGSVVDLRLVDSPRIAALVRSGTEIHVRSIFLQGLLLADAESVPEKFGPLRPALVGLQDLADRHGVSRVAVALQPMLRRPEVSRVVIGASTPGELAEIINAAEELAPHSALETPDVDSQYLDPRRWRDLP